MNSRIKHFMDYKGISSSELADTIGVQRSNVTHVLQGRNKPSFQFISKLLETYPEINAKWLIMGGENMLEQGAAEQQQLFPSEEKKAILEESKDLERASNKPVQKIVQSSEPIQNKVPSALVGKEIERIVVFYTDQTFKEYGPSK